MTLWIVLETKETFHHACLYVMLPLVKICWWYSVRHVWYFHFCFNKIEPEEQYIVVIDLILYHVTRRHKIGRVPPQAKTWESPKGLWRSKLLILGFRLIWPQISPIYRISKVFAQIPIANSLILLFNTQVQYTERDIESHCKSNISVATF